ncbi:CRISPR-associated protein Csx16 [Methylomarinovum tepidoasis]|uniref:CRISPR-associated protein Csx16 n=1 Tax=Methylomarinovum tepidoasis TaxID=2840183 RepID=A0AAU9CW72_9GAMM|nr:CRISPR-associated protein Csx16 [Methylomarinovum sp. IN45]BCX88945.1 CRISPR-associated protein Csx16 [Methylomarinovum sp. IN45]
MRETQPNCRTTFFVSRHPGAVEWARRQGLRIDRQVDHLDVEEIQPGDTVIGTLPVHLAAQVCRRGARYLHLSLEIPPEARGRELSAEELDKYGARLEEYEIRKIQGTA